ncbi:hypothetical protein HYW11_01850 [Candidatus Peregrinibacteria bacterium]|nr:hypothetical protein [Candidatus Peregrinibacteria bacterium]
MTTPTFQTTCTRNRPIARDVYEFTLQKPEGFTYEPGQFVLFSVPLLENSADIQPRAYSIASAPGEPDLRFVLKLREGGRASRWCTGMLREGTPVSMQGPFGALVLDRATTKDYLFLATSTGVAPFRSMIVSTLAAGDTRRMDLLFGAWNEGGLFWTEDFQRLAASHPSFRYHVILDQPPSTWNGHRGHVQDIAPRIVPDCGQRSIYICGNPAMVAAVKQCCLEQWGVPQEDLHVEGYI